MTWRGRWCRPRGSLSDSSHRGVLSNEAIVAAAPTVLVDHVACQLATSRGAAADGLDNANRG